MCFEHAEAYFEHAEAYFDPGILRVGHGDIAFEYQESRMPIRMTPRAVARRESFAPDCTLAAGSDDYRMLIHVYD